MRKIILTAFCLATFSSYAQSTAEVTSASTNQKEYNYLTKGLKIQRESGLDIIAGYDLLEAGKVSIGTQYSFSFSNLIEKSTGNLKAISVVVTSTVTKSTYYLCIPVNNLKLFSEYTDYTYQLSPELAKAFNSALAVQYSNISSRFSDKNKK
ncbi:hypothetical protein DNC80_15135 [Flavobacterium sp. SOK18b]|uniref:hypothetical protein n=1 Tax=Flavobacterium sp. SOK18b TaxID=797900 RepID=UPI0015F9BD8B|nr:hypothetical protein [Flavobacterium sp. SOK18b]MBB1194998.1 hypothetical protein [Flavobacterium sp. SOK18b]